MKKPTWKKIVILLITAFIFISAAAAITVVLIKLSHLDAYKKNIIAFLNTSLSREVSYESEEFSFYFGPTFTFRGMKIKEKNGRDTFATAERVTLKVAVLPLMRGKIVIKKVHLEKPAGILYRDSEGVFNISDLLEKQKTSAIEIRRIIVHHGAMTFTDQHIIPPGLTINLEDIDLRINNPVRGQVTDLKISATVDQQGKKGTLSMTGNIELSDGDKSLLNSSIDARIHAAGLSIERYRPYYEQYLPFRQTTGVLNIDTHLKGNASRFVSEGSVAVKNLDLRYPEVFHTALTPKDVSLGYKIQRTPSEIIMDKLNLKVDDFKISGRCAIKDIDKNDPLITAEAFSSPISLEKFGPFIPYGIISERVADFIKTRIKGGIYQLKEGSINGRISQIAHMDENENYNVLHAKVGVDEGMLSYGKKVPIFSGIKGELELRGKDLLLHNMSGKFGESPIALEGRITDYCLATPASYPFAATIIPGQKEIAWFLGIGGGGNFAFTGKTFLQMTGSGTTNNYALSGRWDLTDVSYSYNDVFTKPQSQSNRVVFESNIKNGKVQVEAFSYQLASLNVSATAIYRIKDQYLSAFTVESNAFQIEDLVSNLPRIRTYQPRGSMRLALTGSGIPKSIADLDLRGNISFSGAAFKAFSTLKAISALNGAVSLGRNRLDTSLLTGRIGGSLIQGRVILKDFTDPSVRVKVSSDLLDPEDVGLQSPSGAIKLRNFTGDIVFRDNGLLIKRLSAQMNDSVFSVTGAMPNVKKPFFDIQVTSPYLNMDDIVLLSKINVLKKEKSTSEELFLKASVQSHKGKINSIPYSELRTTFTYQQQTMDISAFEMNAFNGGFSGKGLLVFAPGGVVQYKIGFILDKTSAEQIMKYAGSEKVLMTGTLTMKGYLTAEGANISDLKKTMRGTATLVMDKGSLNKYAVLSKVFSILNVSQLLKFQLPDMVTEGMPFTSVQGTFSIKDGILSSNDLFVKSNAMNVSIVGTTDIIREELNLNIGIQPLQTVDKIVSTIPVVGWILTNDTKSLITLYFQAQGKRSDPTVNAIPVTSLSKGVLDIFKKLFQLPEKLITDTGEVIMGQ